MGQFTRVSQYLLDWPPFVKLRVEARYVWMVLYIGHEAKRWLPGLLRISPSQLADTARMGYIDAQNQMTVLESAGLIERDQSYRLVRLTQLPDKGDQPANSKVLRMCWNRWRDLPDVPIRYRYLPTLEWLVDPHRSEKLQSTWNDTFGAALAKVPSDWMTEVIHTPVDNLREGGQLPLIAADTHTVEDTVSDTVSHTVGSPESGVRSTVSDRVGGAGGRGKRKPGNNPDSVVNGHSFTVNELLAAIARRSDGRIATDILDPRIGRELWDVCEMCDKNAITLEDIELVGEYVGAGYLSYRSDLDTRWIARAGTIAGAVSKARQWALEGKGTLGRKQKGKSAQRMLARARQLRDEEANS